MLFQADCQKATTKGNRCAGLVALHSNQTLLCCDDLLQYMSNSSCALLQRKHLKLVVHCRAVNR